MAGFKVGEAPWETSTATGSNFAVGTAPWELPPPTAPEPQQPNYFQRVGSQYGAAGQDIVSNLSRREQYPGQNVIRSVGDIAGAAFAPIMEVPLVKKLTESVVSSIPGAHDVIQKAADLATKYPNAAKDLTSVINIVSLGLGGAAEKPILNEVKAIGQDISQGTKLVLNSSESAVQSKVLDLFNKSIKPTAQKTSAKAASYDNSVLNALTTIKRNANNLNIEDATGELIAGRTPQTINELAQGLEQTKKTVFSQYDELAKRANGLGAQIDAKPIADEVGKVAQNKALQLTNPGIIKYAEEWQKRLQGFGVLDTETTQEVIKLMNTNLSAFYRNPTYDAASKVTIDAGIANNFRVALDKAIDGATGEQYQVLKNQYAALKAIENDVVRASMRDARKNAKGLLDYTDMFTGGQMVGGILSLNPAMFTKGAIERGFKEYIKYLNDPNRAIKNLFDKLNIDPTKSFEPVSMTGKALKNPSLGLSIKDVSGGKASVPNSSVGSQSKAVSGTLQKGLGKSSPIPTTSSPISKGASYDQVASVLEKYDTTPLTVNGKISLDSTPADFRLAQLQEKLKTTSLTPAELKEAQQLLQKMGALESKP